METNSVSGRYETRRSRRAEEPVAKSRVDWNRTKRTRVLDSEEEDDEITSASEKEVQTSSEDEGEEEGKSMVIVSNEETTVNGGGLPVIKASCDGTTEEDVEEESIVPGKNKRSRSSVIHDDSDGSDDSGIVRKVFAKRSCVVDEEDSSAEKEQHTSPVEEKKERKQKRLMKLRELSLRRSTQARSDSDHHEDTYPSPFNLSDVSDSADDDSMKEFIVEEEEEEEEEEGKEVKQEESEDDERQLQEKKHAKSRRTLLERHIPDLVRQSPSSHLKRTVRAFLINAVDGTFLSSLYEGERQKRYAQEMLASLRYLDNRIIQPRLDNLISRSRWKERYQERVDSYPNVSIIFGNSEERSCQACELQRYCRLTVVLSGKLYNTNTMEIDDFMSHDKQRLKVGIVCGNRTEVYHKLKHFKYKLYQDCCSVMKQDDCQDEPLKDRVGRVFSQLEEDGWIQKHYTDLEGYMDDADNFQEEKMD
ncbi:UNVERIFIED_CONTAM: hypothetical protein K2H54_068018 [Gekko kuhli]